MNPRLLCLLITMLLAMIAAAAIPESRAADSTVTFSRGQKLYVPAYSHIYIGNRERPFPLTVTLSIRNIDPAHAIEITRVDYYETQGTLLKEYIDTPVTIAPLGAIRYVIPERDKSGGSGANFLVEWRSRETVNEPIVESIMIGTQTQQGISFTSRGKEISVPPPAQEEAVD